MPVDIQSTLTQTLSNDVDGDGNIDPGDTLLNELIVTNTGDTTVTDIIATLTENGMTIDPGSVQIGPVAHADTIDITGNTPVIITTAQLIGNDSDADGNAANLTVTNVSAGDHGTIVDNGDGTFTFTPEAGFTGAASFTYETVDEDGLASVGAAEVTVNVTGLVWYVDSAYDGSNGASDGSYDRPYTSLDQLNGAGGTGDADSAGDTIFVYDRGPGAYSANLQLEANQTLVGDGTAFVVNGIAIGAGSGNTTLNYSDVGITLSTGNTVSGFNLIGTSTSAVGVSDGNGTVGTLTMSNTTIAGQGQILDIDQGGTLNVSLNSIGSIGSTGGNGGVVDLTGVSGTFTVSGTTVISGSHGQNGIDISGNSGLTVSFGNNVTADLGTNSAINIGSNTGTNSFTFNGGTTNLDTTSGTAFAFTGNSAGSTLSMSGGGLDIDSTTGTGFSATGGGTVTVTGAGNSITTTAGTALNISNTNIGAADVTFQSISAGSAAGTSGVGVILDTTGSAGGLHITGNGTAGSGGTIQHFTGTDNNSAAPNLYQLSVSAGNGGVGIYLNNTTDVQLNNVQLNDFSNFGIYGHNVTGFALTNSVVNGVNGNNHILNAGTASQVTLSEGAIHFDELTGNVAVTNNTIQGGLDDNLAIVNVGTGLLNFTASGNTFGATQVMNTAVASGGDNLTVSSFGGGSITALVDDNDFLGEVGNAVYLRVSNGGTGNFTVTDNYANNLIAYDAANNNYTHNLGTSVGGNIGIISENGAAVNFLVEGNTVLGTIQGSAIGVDSNNASVNGSITGNIVGDPTLNNSGSVQGSGISFGSVAGGGNSIVNISNNLVREYNGQGIFIALGDEMGNSTPDIDLTITGNTVNNPGNTPGAAANRFGLYVNVGTTSSNGGDDLTATLEISNNNLVGSYVGIGSDISLQQRFGTTVILPGYSGAADNNTAVGAYLAGQNTLDASNGTRVTNNVSGTGHGFINGADPSAPGTPLLPPAAILATIGGSDSGTDGGAGAPDGQAGSPDDATTSHDLTQAQLDAVIDAAIQRWADTGASDEQLAAMRAATISVADMTGVYLATSNAGTITIDSNGAGHGWFVDGTPGDDSEFGGSGTSLTAIAGSGADGAMDLLTVVMHELGHQVGLGDSYQSGDAGSLMYGYANVGERRLPGAGDVANGDFGDIGATAYALAPVSLGTLDAGSGILVQYTSTVWNFSNMVIPTYQNYATVDFTPSTGGVTSNLTALVVETLTLGDRVWYDANGDGEFEPLYEDGLSGVTISLYADANNDNIADGAAIATTITDADGYYVFDSLAPGNYIVSIDAANFQTGSALEGMVVSGLGLDPDNNEDGDSNGRAMDDGSVASRSITLSYGDEPSVDVFGNNTNNTLDFGFFTPNVAPVVAELQGDTVTWNETDGAIYLDNGGNAAVTDADSNSFASGSLTVSISSGFVAGEDQLRIADGSVMIMGEFEPGAIVLINGALVGTVGEVRDDSITIQFSTGATPARVSELIRSFTYQNNAGNGATGGDRTITWNLVDGGGSVLGGDDTTTVTSTVNVVAVDDPAVAQDDEFTTNEQTVVTGNLFADNGYGADSDPDGPPLQIAEVNGSAANVGTQFTTSTGTLLTVNADGTFSFDPNGAYRGVPSPESGGQNTLYAEYFTYTLANGNTVFVTLFISGLDSEGDVVFGRLDVDDTLDGGIGADVMYGLTGNDLFYVDNVGDAVVENAGEGDDTVRSSVTYRLPANVETISLTGSANINAVGNGLDNRLYGNSGDNVLNGSTGADYMLGGVGDDTYIVDNLGDRAIENDGEGIDTVRSSVDFRLTRYVENLVLTGTGAIEGIGNAFDNVIVGNAGDNFIHGAGGSDSMRGGEGNDTYVVWNAGDTVVEAAGAGHDTVRTIVDFALGANVEDLILTGAGTISGTGNGLANYMLGNSSANILAGRGGDDAINGAAGNDRLLGEAGNDNLNGGNGADFIVGGTGSDDMTGGAGADLFVFYQGDFGGADPVAADRIRDFSRGEGDIIRLNNVDANTTVGGDQAFAFIGSGAFTGHAGELRYEQLGVDTYVFGDTNGDGTADFAIRVDGSHTFVAGDFIL
ncbi:cadherin-like domain-containing protein [Sphingomonas sabuli]|uniref:Cadherin-like domain-containing protein n=1 Tax=Sphingomonas sabuli TaxID=2764186 RepID=A0A7G9L2Z3_9SPHN|nr:Ig-like domain-containing protein [Sphingomonas sabuli]QNM82992.1 cadherin-like domain-containing protein [Sphingomonas sabuli]